MKQTPLAAIQVANLASHKRVEPIRHCPTATTQDQLLFGRKSNTEMSEAFINITTHDTLAHRLEGKAADSCPDCEPIL